MLSGFARLVTYWLFLFWLLLGFSANALEVLNYLEDWETYHRVYRDPLLYFAIVGSFALLHGIALVLQKSPADLRKYFPPIQIRRIHTVFPTKLGATLK